MSSSRIVLVTGGTTGIGLATVNRFAAEGDEVFTCSRHPLDSCPPWSNGTQISHRVVNVGDPHALTTWINDVGVHTGRVDVLVNNAAAVFKKPIREFSETEFRQSLEVNLLALLNSTKTVLQWMQKNSGGTIINMSSMAAVDPFPGFSVYGACKAFVELFTQALASEINEQPIRCFSVRAGAVETRLLREVLPEFPQSESIRPEHIAELIFQLVSSSRFKSGQAIEITKDNLDSFEWF